jgi:hypothetical protein
MGPGSRPSTGAVHGGSTGRHGAGWSLVVLCLLAALVVAVVGPDGRGDEEPPGAGGGYDVQVLPGAPLAARRLASSAWTQHGLFVWGGEVGTREEAENDTMGGAPSPAFSDGAVYDPATRCWTAVTDSPLTARAGAPAIATGDGVLVVGGWTRGGRSLRSDGALYSPGADTWSPVPDAPTCPQHLVEARHGLVALGSCGPGLPDAARWHPRTGRWHLLPDTGLDAVQDAFSVDGHVLVVGPAGRLRRLDGAAWTGLPSAATPAGQDLVLAAGPAGVFSVVYDDGTGEGVVRRLEPDGWRDLARGPRLAPTGPVAGAVATPDGVLWSTQGGLCRWDGDEPWCVHDPGSGSGAVLGLGRFATTPTHDGARTVYLWGGDYVRDGESSSTTNDTGLAVTW